MPVLDCASLVIFKAFFDRTSDWADIEAVALGDPGGHRRRAEGRSPVSSATTILPSGS